MSFNPLLLAFFPHSFSGHSLRQALFVYRLIVATLKGIFFDDPLSNKNKDFSYVFLQGHVRQ